MVFFQGNGPVQELQKHLAVVQVEVKFCLFKFIYMNIKNGVNIYKKNNLSLVQTRALTQFFISFCIIGNNNYQRT